MHKIVKGLCLIGVLLLAALPALAQDATPVFVPTTVPVWPGQEEIYPTEMTLGDVSFNNNICPEELIEANRDTFSATTLELIDSAVVIDHALWVQLPREMTIPPHNNCYTEVISPSSELPKVEITHNVCIEELNYFTRPMGDSEGQWTTVYVRKDAPPCVNEDGQRLRYFAQDGQRLKTPVYTDDAFVGGQDIIELSYCPRDLVKANPGIRFNVGFGPGEVGYVSGMRLFIPQNAPSCYALMIMEGKGNVNLYQLSQSENICMEAIVDANTMRLFSGPLNQFSFLYMPDDLPPCYDDTGSRIGYKDRAVYTPEPGESFLDIARAHDVCLQDLWDHNPVMNAWYEWPYLMPDAVFIPDTAPCDQHQHTVQTTLTWYGVSLLTNTCINRLIEANPSLKSAWLEDLPVGATLNIPQRPNCYDLTNTQNGVEMQPYICYSVPVTAESDFTDHQPAITAALNTDLPYCYDREQGITVFSNNEPYTLYMSRGYETFVVLSQCFGVKPEELYILNLYDSFHNAWSVTPASLDTIYQGPLLVPQPHADCLLLVEDNSLHWQRYVEMTYQAGSLQEGVYTVNYGDTLSSIGRKYGYLPQSIADENDLSDPTMILYLQELKMPTYPSLYTLAPVGAAVGGLVVAGGLFYGLRLWSRSRGKSKKKNS